MADEYDKMSDKWETDLDHQCNEAAVCMYCGYEDFVPEMGDQEVVIRDGAECGNEIRIVRHIKITYGVYSRAKDSEHKKKEGE